MISIRRNIKITPALTRQCLSFIFFLIYSMVCAPAYSQNIAVLSSKRAPLFLSTVEAMAAAVKKNKNAAKIDVFYSEDKDFLNQINSKKYDIFFPIGIGNTKAIIDNFKDTPIVFLSVDPVQTGIIKSTAPSGTNVCGISLRVGAKEQIGIIKKIVPNLNNVGIIYGESSSGFYEELNALEGLKVKAEKVSSSFKIPSVAPSFNINNIDAFLMVLDGDIYNADSLAYVLNYAASNKIPTMVFSPALAKAGGLVSYTYDYADLGIQAGEIILDILNGKSPGEIPLAAPRKISYVLNTKTAKAINVNLSPDIISSASEIYK